MTTLPPIHAWFNSLDWNLSYCNRPKLIAADLPLEFANVNDESDRKFERPPLIRSTSLKSSSDKTKEPQRRKSVRFADTVGLDLESVRLIPKEQPKVPTSAFSHLKISDDTNSVQNHFKQRLATQLPPWTVRQDLRSKLIPDFVEPSTLVDFIDRVRNQKVCLQNCFIATEGTMINVKCIILVVNLSFSKHVTVRYTTDNWQSWVDVEAKYVPNSCNGWSDKFMADFSICTDGSSSALVPGQKILLAVRYESDGREYWDNNLGANYSFTYRL